MSKRKLIEVSLPLEAMNAASAKEKSIRQGHPSTLHLYWARRPLATARAILFAQLVDDPSSNPEEFPTVEQQDAERQRLHKIIESFVDWKNLNNEELLATAEAEIRKSNNGNLPVVLDPFAGGGSIPLEAQRLGMKAIASDLNPLSVLLSKALIEIPKRFKSGKPVFPSMADSKFGNWQNSQALSADVQEYAKLLRSGAESQIGHLYPKVRGADGVNHNVIAWIWARTVQNPNPAYPFHTPLVKSWWLSKAPGKEAYVKPLLSNGEVAFKVVIGPEGGPTGEQDGTIGRSGATSLGDSTAIPMSYIRAEAQAGRLGKRLIAMVAEGSNGRTYLSPTSEHEILADVERPTEVPDYLVPTSNHDVDRLPMYGMKTWAEAFSPRQLTALTTLIQQIPMIHDRVIQDAISADWQMGESLEQQGNGARAYADAVATYLALGISRTADYNNSLCTWINKGQTIRNLFSKQAIQMAWDYAESNPFSNSTGNFLGQIKWITKVIDNLPTRGDGEASAADAATRQYEGLVISTDPPYYDNIRYADLSDFFYIWLRESLGNFLPETFSTLLTPKGDELVANANRHGGKKGAEDFFVRGFNNVFSRIRETANKDAPLTIYYAYKQQDDEGAGASSTGWHTLLNGLIASGWEITATWPVRSELANRMVGHGANALASSIVLACRPRDVSASATTRRAFLAALKSELPLALRKLIQGAIAPVDLAQAAIGPGISVFSRYSRVREPDGSNMSVKEALLVINSTLDEVLNEQESDFDPDTRFAVKWYKQFGWSDAPSGVADQLARSSDTSIGALERGGVFEAKAGKAKLYSPSQFKGEWQPEMDDKISVWECVVRLAGIMSYQGAEAVARLLPAIESRVGLDPVKELCFLLFHEAEKKSDTKDATLFNGLVSAWSELRQQARAISESAMSGTQIAINFDELGE
jgi:putative DNA methylase